MKRRKTTEAPRCAVLITGAGGYIGRLVTSALAEARGNFETIVATDLRPIPEAERLEGVVYAEADIRSSKIARLVADHAIDTLVHLAAVVTPKKSDSREFLFEVDVEGTRGMLDACVEHNVRKFIYTSSGAAYGYREENRPLIRESDPLRGNEEFAYSWHKRLVEEMLAELRESHPALEQLIFRVSTILGPTVHNQITAHFERPVVVGVENVAAPFCFISDQDVVGAIVQGVLGDGAGVFNLTGDGAMTLREIASALGRPYIAVSMDTMEKALETLHRLNLSAVGPEQLLFLLHRPVLDNRRLKEAFGYRPRLSSRQVFELYRASRAAGKIRAARQLQPGPTRQK